MLSSMKNFLRNKFSSLRGKHSSTLQRWLCQKQDATESSDTFHSECEVSYEGGKDLKNLFQRCQKNPGHPGFIPIQDFLSPEKNFCEPDKLESIRRISDRIVRVLVFSVSEDRPDVYEDTSSPYPFVHLKGKDCLRCGSGFIWDVQIVQSECPCKSCTTTSVQPERTHYEIKVQTAAHVVYDDEEAVDTVMECFYDAEDDRTEVRTLQGVRAESWPHRDYCVVTCVTHNKEIVDRFWGKDFNVNTVPSCWFRENIQGWIISHPHGRSKHVSQGRIYYSSYKGHKFVYAGRKPFRVPWVPSLFQKSSIPATQLFKDPNYRYYILPERARWIFPEVWFDELGYYLMLSKSSFRSGYLKVPSGTMIALPGGKKLLRCPNKAEFDIRDLVGHLVYDMNTCPGSSGAPLLCTSSVVQLQVIQCVSHAGAERGKNRSSLDNVWSNVLNSHFVFDCDGDEIYDLGFGVRF